MWSVGCVFAELLGLHAGNQKSFRTRPEHPGSRVLLKGDSCISLGERPPAGKEDGEDQLGAILSLIGLPTTAEINKLENNTFRDFFTAERLLLCNDKVLFGVVVFRLFTKTCMHKLSFLLTLSLSL